MTAPASTSAPVRTIRILGSTRQPGICRTCRAGITWARTYPGLKAMPLHGNPPAVRTDNVDGDAIETIHSTDTHFAQCPRVPRWSNRGRVGGADSLFASEGRTEDESNDMTTTRLFIVCPRAKVPVEMGPLPTRFGAVCTCVVCGETHALPYRRYERERNVHGLTQLLPRLVELAADDVRDPELAARLAQFVAHEVVRLRAGKAMTAAMPSRDGSSQRGRPLSLFD